MVLSATVVVVLASATDDDGTTVATTVVAAPGTVLLAGVASSSEPPKTSTPATAASPTTAPTARATSPLRLLPAGGGATGSGARTGACHAAAAAAGAAMAAGSTVGRLEAPTSAAPVAIANFGWASSATGRPVPARTISATTGIRDVPPTSSTRLTCSMVMPADATARSSARTVSATRGRTIFSNSSRVSRTSVCTPGSATGIVVSLSFDSASFARRHSTRSRAWPGSVLGSVRSAPDTSPPSDRSTWARTAWSKSMPPRRSMPSGMPMSSKPVVVRRTDRRVERAAAEVVDGHDLARLDASAGGRSAIGGGLGLGEQLHSGRVEARPGGRPRAAGRACSRCSSPGG